MYVRGGNGTIITAVILWPFTSIMPNPTIAMPGSIPIILIVTSLPIIRYNVIMATNWFGIVGRNGPGKSTVCEYLVSKGYRVYSLSDVVRNHATEQGLGHDRDTLTSLANQLKADHGTDFFAKAVADSAKGQPFVVFDSIRHPSEIHYLRSHNVQLLGFIAL